MSGSGTTAGRGIARSRLASRPHPGTLVAVALAVANLLGYGLNLVASRRLGPHGFGALGAILGLVLVGNVLALGLQAVAARRISAARARGATAPELAGLSTRLSAVAFRCAAALLLVGLVAVAPVAVLLHLRTPWAALALALTLPSLAVTGVQLGLLQGAERLTRLASLYLVAALGKVGGGLAGVLLGTSVTATMSGTAAGALVSAVVGQRLLGGGQGTAGTSPGSRRELVREVAYATNSMLALFALSNVDVVLARHYLSPAQAGRYAVGSIIAKGAFWLPSFVAVIALPAMADVARRRRVATRAALSVGACGLVVTLATASASGLVIRFVAGPRYSSLADQLWLFALAGSLFALAQLLLYSRIAAGDRRALLPIWGAFVMVVVITSGSRHGSIAQIVTTVVLAAALLVAVGLAAEIDEHRSSHRSGADATRQLPAGQRPGE